MTQHGRRSSFDSFDAAFSRAGNSRRHAARGAPLQTTMPRKPETTGSSPCTMPGQAGMLLHGGGAICPRAITNPCRSMCQRMRQLFHWSQILTPIHKSFRGLYASIPWALLDRSSALHLAARWLLFSICSVAARASSSLAMLLAYRTQPPICGFLQVARCFRDGQVGETEVWTESVAYPHVSAKAIPRFSRWTRFTSRRMEARESLSRSTSAASLFQSIWSRMRCSEMGFFRKPQIA